MLDASSIRDVFARYAACLGEGDVPGIVALFSPLGVLEDPIGVCYRGPAQIAEFFRSSLSQVGGSIHFVADGQVRISGRHAACAFTAICASSPEPFEVDTLDMATFDEQGLIVSMVAIWGPDNVRALGRK